MLLARPWAKWWAKRDQWKCKEIVPFRKSNDLWTPVAPPSASPSKGPQQTPSKLHPQPTPWPQAAPHLPLLSLQQVLEPLKLVFYSPTTRWQHKARRPLGLRLARDMSAWAQGLKGGRRPGPNPAPLELRCCLGIVVNALGWAPSFHASPPHPPDWQDTQGPCSESSIPSRSRVASGKSSESPVCS